MTFEQYLEWLEQNKAIFPMAPRSRPEPKHPGQVLREEVLEKLAMTQSELAHRLHCRFAKVNEIINKKRAVTPEFALQLEKLLGIPAEAWVSLQADYDLWQARQKASSKDAGEA